MLVELAVVRIKKVEQVIFSLKWKNERLTDDESDDDDDDDNGELSGVKETGTQQTA